MDKKIIRADGAGKLLSDWLRENGYGVDQPCGGRGVCGKCAVETLNGQKILACRTVIPENGLEIILPDTDSISVSADDTALDRARIGAALDIGTTTLALAVVDLESRKIIRTVSCLNPQKSYGADVMSRISACDSGKLSELQNVLLNAVREMCKNVICERLFEQMTVTGNPTMLHIFCGISPEGMGRYPFTPAFLETKILSGADMGLPVENITVLPSASAFIGGDIVCGVLHSGVDKTDGSMLVDVGTNGEMVLSANGKLYSASVAAGPALEGANISCGMGGVSGAVSAVYAAAGNFHYRTVGDADAVGICGCGLTDLIACLLDAGIIDETGYIESDFVLNGVHEDKNGKILCEGETKVRLTPRDIREFQLAKSAVRAGVDALAAHAGIKLCDIGQIFVAGGLGLYMSPVSAVRVGMFPPEFAGKLKPVGNSALDGAIDCLCDGDMLARGEIIATECENIELNSSAVFENSFVENMIFPEWD